MQHQSQVASTDSLDDEGGEPDFKPLTAEEARQWRQENPVLSPWRIVVMQGVVAVLVAVLGGLLTMEFRVAVSAGYGGLAVVVPAALFARGLLRHVGRAGSALAAFALWELVKVVLAVAMLAAAPKLIPQLSWLALLAGFVLTSKVYWVAMWRHSSRRGSAKRI